jgi:HTH-type transcriptional regulator/antitoxin HigA
VIKELFKLGITVIFQSSFSSLHLRGATFSVNSKPCIVLTDYKGFYPTLWHALVHELYHVLFDWEKLRNDSYHLSEDLTDDFGIDENEIEADHFAREYLFSKAKSNEIKGRIWSETYVDEIAKNGNVHPSIVYIYNAFDSSSTDRMVWARTRRKMPDIKDAISRIENPWQKCKPIEDIAKQLRREVYN